MSRKTILFIVGSGHSGSTILGVTGKEVLIDSTKPLKRAMILSYILKGYDIKYLLDQCLYEY